MLPTMAAAFPAGAVLASTWNTALVERVGQALAQETKSEGARVLWDGLVMSDWLFSVKSTAASVNAGLDLEMLGPPQWRGEKLVQAVRAGEVAESTLDESVRRLLLLLVRTGKLDHPEEEPERAVDLPEHRALIREAAGEGIVLLLPDCLMELTSKLPAHTRQPQRFDDPCVAVDQNGEELEMVRSALALPLPPSGAARRSSRPWQRAPHL